MKSQSTPLQVGGVNWASSAPVLEPALLREPRVLAADAAAVSQTAIVTYGGRRGPLGFAPAGGARVVTPTITGRASPAVGPRWLRSTVVTVVAVVIGGFVTSASPAWAHGEGESDVGYQLVQQSLGFLAAHPGTEAHPAALEKIYDALATDEQEGIDVAQLQQARSTLEAGQIQEARSLLESAISQAVSELAPATGEDTGTGTVRGPLPGREGWTDADGALLGGSLLLVLGGGALAYRLRPADSVGALRRRLGPAASKDTS